VSRLVAIGFVFVFGCCVVVFSQEPVVDATADTTAASRQAIIGQPAGPELAGEALDRKTAEVTALLRCPVCQGLSIADSPASMAVNMKREVRDLLAAGYSAEQVLAYFEKSYGEFVRLQPPLRGFNWLVWLAPIAALLVGLFIVRRFVRPASSGTGVIENVDASDPDADPYLDQVRRLAYSQTDTKDRRSGPVQGKS